MLRDLKIDRVCKTESTTFIELTQFIATIHQRKSDTENRDRIQTCKRKEAYVRAVYRRLTLTNVKKQYPSADSNVSLLGAARGKTRGEQREVNS